MTDEQIIKALECCNRPTNEGRCKECPYYKIDGRCTSILLDKTIDLINLQKARIKELEERISYLEESIDCSRKEYNRLLQKLQQAKSEALKKFAERLKNDTFLGKEKKSVEHTLWIYEIDNLVKAMTEADE